MALTASTVLELGMTAPAFSLPDVISGKTVSLQDLKSDTATIVMFICNHCPYVIHIQAQLIIFASDYIPKGVSVIAINSNDAKTYSEDSPTTMKAVASQLQYPFPYLYDETQAVAKAYKAACTPEFYLFDRSLHLVYHGQFDDARPGTAVPVTGKSLRVALDALLSHAPIDPNQKSSTGCNIKWRE